MPNVRRAAGPPLARRLLVAVLTAVALFLPLAGYRLYLPHAEADARRSTIDNLNLRLDLRETVLSRWLTGGLADAQLVASYPSVRALVQPSAAALDDHLSSILRSFAEIERYERVLVATDTRVVVQSDSGALTPACVPGPGDPRVRLHMHGDRAYVAFAAPVGPSAPAATVVVEQAAGDYLFPFMTHVFQPLSSAESVLVGRDGQRVQYLSPLKSAAAVSDVPSVDTAALVTDSAEHTGLVGASGRPVLAVGRKLHGVPWTLVMRVNSDEALEPARRASRIAWAASNAAVVALAMSVVTFYGWQRRRHVELLALSQAHLGQVLDHARDPILFLTEDGHVVEANARAAEFYGYPPGGLAGVDTIEELHAPADRAPCREVLARLMREQQLRFEARHRRADGTIIAVDINAATIDLDSYIRIVAVVRDMTEHAAERSRAERLSQLLQVRARVIEQLSGEGSAADLMESACRTIATDAGLPLAWVGFAEPDGSVRPVARAGSAAAYLDGLALGWKDGPDADGPTGRSIREGRMQVSRHGEPGFDAAAEITLAYGITALASAPIVQDGHVIGALGIGAGELVDLGVDLRGFIETIAGDLGLALAAVDAREARRAQSAALQENVARFRALFEQSPIGIAIGTLTGEIERINPALEQFLGYTEAEMRRLTFRDVTPADELAREEPLFRAMAAGERDSYSLEKRFTRKDHRLVWGELSVTIVRHGNTPSFVLAIVRDVTDRRALQEQLVHSQKMEGIGRLAGGVAHDFNNLLTAILGYAEVLGGELAGDHPGQAFIHEIQKAGTRAAALTSQLLAFARRQIAQPRVVDLGDVVKDAEPLMNRLIGQDVTFTVAKQPGLWKVEADVNQIQQILVNMVVNARDAMPHGGAITIDLANAPATPEPGGETREADLVRMSISDTGTGISPDVISHIFEPFFTTKEQGKGTGLGLATCHGIVVQSGGEIRVKSEPGRGTTFDVLLPRTTRLPTDSAAAQAGPAHGRGEVVLLVEDEAAVRGLAVRCLAGGGYRVLEAATGAMALEIAGVERDRIHLLITDVVMPEMGGRELAGRFGVLCPDASVLYISGHPEGGNVPGRPPHESIDYLPKPFTADQILRRVREMLDARGA